MMRRSISGEFKIELLKLAADRDFAGGALQPLGPPLAMMNVFLGLQGCSA
jgi:hypothetical protein